MKGHDVAALHQLLQGDILDAHVQGLLPAGAGMGDDPRAEGQEQPGGAQADGTGAHDAHSFAADLRATKGGAGAALPDGSVTGGHESQAGHRQPQGQLGYALSGIARGVGQGDALLPAGVQPHVVDAGKGHVDELQIGRAQDDRGGKGGVGNDDCVGVGHTGGLLRGVGGFGSIGNKGVAGGFQLAAVAVQHGLGDAQGLHKGDLHKNGPPEKFLPHPVYHIRQALQEAPGLLFSQKAPGVPPPFAVEQEHMAHPRLVDGCQLLGGGVRVVKQHKVGAAVAFAVGEVF